MFTTNITGMDVFALFWFLYKNISPVEWYEKNKPIWMHRFEFIVSFSKFTQGQNDSDSSFCLPG